MRVLGVDPGLAALGYGVIEVAGARPRPVAHGVLGTRRDPTAGVGQDLAARVSQLAAAFAALLDAHRPDEAALEEFRYYGVGVTSSLQLANVVGMLREALRARRIPSAEYSAQQIKRAVTGYATADKKQVQKMVKLQLGLREAPRPVHAADALAAALTHASRLPVRRAAETRR